MANKPILITGTHRSGTTWVGNVLAKNPRYALVYEPFNLKNKPGRHWINFEHWFTYICDENAAAYRAGLDHTMAFDYSPWLKLRDMPTWDGLKQCYFEARDYREYRREGKVPLVKDPIAFFSAPFLAKTYGMQVLVLIRHPAAFVSSLKRMNWGFDGKDLLNQPLLMRDVLPEFREELESLASPDVDYIDRICSLWNIFHTVILQYQERFPDWVFVRHEDLSSDPETEFGKLCASLEVEYNPEMRDYVRSLNDEGTEDVAGRKLHQLKRNSQHNIKIWKERLAPAEIDRIRKRTATISDKFYALEDW